MSTELGSDALTQALRRDRLLVGAGLFGIAALSWLYIIRMGTTMSANMAMPMATPDGAPALVWLIPMWIVMMVAMMVPSAAPMILLFATVAGQRRARGVRTASAWVFTLGYLLAWALYATIAATIQAWLHQQALLSPSMASTSNLLAGGLLVLAGVYQLMPAKGACLSHCRSPLSFFSSHWREGISGALRMGFQHGTFCVGCCWALMVLLFVAGVMNLLWVATIAIFVLAEKLFPAGRRIGQVTGTLLIGWGIWMLAAPGHAA
jgi:predicted metal-binding membrane protein